MITIVEEVTGVAEVKVRTRMASEDVTHMRALMEDSPWKSMLSIRAARVGVVFMKPTNPSTVRMYGSDIPQGQARRERILHIYLQAAREMI